MCKSFLLCLMIPFCLVSFQLSGNNIAPPVKKTKLDAMMNVHPRMYLSDEKIILLKKKIKTEPYLSFFNTMKTAADEGVRKGPPEYILNDGSSGDEQLWQRDVGNMIPHLSMMFLLSGEKKYFDSAVAFMRASCGYRTWGINKYDGKDLSVGHQLYGLALGYDWLYRYLDDNDKVLIKNTLVKRTSFIFGLMADDKVYWSRSYLQNHLWVNAAGIAAAGFALYGEADDAAKWISLTLEKFKTTMTYLGDDGASHEGIPYWTYGAEYMLKFMDLSKDLLGEDLFKGNKWFSNTALFRIYGGLPQKYLKSRSTLMTFADGQRYDWYGSDYILRKLASEYSSGYAQSLADIIGKDNLGVEKTGCFLNLLWYDASVKSRPLSELPSFKYFNDMDIVYSRSGWSGEESVFAFKCGPYTGHYDLKKSDRDSGGGHVHPDAGAFQIFSNGDWLITDDGYSLKLTEYQNTLTVNGIGQTGEGKAWFDGGIISKTKRAPRIIKAFSTKAYDFAEGDAAPAYKDEAGLSGFTRSIIFIKPNYWAVIDRVESVSPSVFEFHFHSDFKFRQKDGMYEARGKNGVLRLMSYSGEKTNFEIIDDQGILGVGGKVEKHMHSIIVSNSSPSLGEIFVTMLESYPAEGKSVMTSSVSGSAAGRDVTVDIPGKSFLIHVPRNRSENVTVSLK